MSSRRGSLFGHLDSDPKLIQTKSGNLATLVCLVVDLPRGTARINVFAFGRLADALGRYEKGDVLVVSGKLDRAARQLVADCIYPDSPNHFSVTTCRPAPHNLEADGDQPPPEGAAGFSGRTEGDLRIGINAVELWLCAELATGSLLAAHILATAQGNGISSRTLRRAKKRAGIVAYRKGGRWWWRAGNDAG